ncbi:MAG: tetratricopeptide repeat protein [Pirellulales bacterium]
MPDEPESPRRGETTYQNPFATTRKASLQLAPPVDPPARPGPLSRWQRSSLLPDEPSSVRTAILGTSPSQFDPFPSDQLIRPDSLGGGNISQPPDPIQFAPRPLTQPAWLTSEEVESARPLPLAGISADVDPITIDTFRMPGGQFGCTSNERIAILGDASAAGDGIAAATNPDWLPIVVSDFVDSPENCYEQARELSDTAQTVDQFSTAIDLCHRGLGGGPPRELAVALRRLAAWAYNRRGELRSDAREQQDAFADFQAAISLDPTCWVAIHNRGVTLAERGQSSAALRDFNRALDLNPSLTVAYRNRAELLASVGRMTEAVRDYSRALERSLNDADLYRARGIAWQRLGDFDRALTDLNKSLALAPDQPDAYTQRGNLSAEQGEFDGAINYYQQALEIDTNWGEAHRSLAWLWATCPNPRYRSPEQALAAAEQARTLAPPGDSFVLDTAAAAHANAGQFEDAIRMQEQAIAAAPPDLVEQMQQRLALYQQGEPFRSGQPRSAVKPASLNAPAAPRLQR